MSTHNIWKWKCQGFLHFMEHADSFACPETDEFAVSSEHTFYWPFGGHIKLQNWKCGEKRNELEQSPVSCDAHPPNSLAWLVFVFLNFAVTFVPLVIELLGWGAEHTAQLTTAHSSKFSWWEVESLRVEISRGRASKIQIIYSLAIIHIPHSHETCRGEGGFWIKAKRRELKANKESQFNWSKDSDGGKHPTGCAGQWKSLINGFFVRLNRFV